MHSVPCRARVWRDESCLRGLALLLPPQSTLDHTSMGWCAPFSCFPHKEQNVVRCGPLDWECVLLTRLPLSPCPLPPPPPTAVVAVRVVVAAGTPWRSLRSTCATCTATGTASGGTGAAAPSRGPSRARPGPGHRRTAGRAPSRAGAAAAQPPAPTRPAHGTAAAPAPTRRAPGPTRPGPGPGPTPGHARPRPATTGHARPAARRLAGEEEEGTGAGGQPPRAPRTDAGHAAAATGLAHGHLGGHDAVGTTTTAAVAATEAGGPTTARAHRGLRDLTITTRCPHCHPTTWDHRRRTATAAGRRRFGPTGVDSTADHRVATPTTLATRITPRSTWCRRWNSTPGAGTTTPPTITATA